MQISLLTRCILLLNYRERQWRQWRKRETWGSSYRYL